MIFGIAASVYVITYECPPDHACPASGTNFALILYIPITLIGAGITIVGIVLEWKKISIMDGF